MLHTFGGSLVISLRSIPRDDRWKKLTLLLFFFMSCNHNYYVYMMTNRHKNVLYIGITNSLERRVYEHENALSKGFTEKYNCHFLIYYEHFTDINLAIRREKQIKRWRREKKDALIATKNPRLKFLNDNVKSL